MIAQKIRKACNFLHISDITLLLKSFEKNKPDFQIQDGPFQVRQLFAHTSNKDDEKIEVAECLQMKVFDEKSNCKKSLEVFLVENVKHGFDLIVKYSKEGQKLIRTDLILKIYDSYYLDDTDIFYVIEYEEFEIDSSPSLQLESLDSYFEQIYSYSKRSLFPFPTMNSGMQALCSCCFVFQRDDQNNLTVKMNIVDPFVFQELEGQNQKEEYVLSRNQLVLVKDIKRSTLSEEIKKEDLLKIIQLHYPCIFECHSEILQYLVDRKADYERYIPLKFTLDSLTLDINQYLQSSNSSEMQRNSTHLQILQGKRIELTKYTSQEIMTQQMNRLQYQRRKLEQAPIESMVNHFEEIPMQNGGYILVEVDITQLNSCVLIKSLEQKASVLKEFPLNIGHFQSTQSLNKYYENYQYYLGIVSHLIQIYPILNELQISLENIFIKTDQNWILDESPFNLNNRSVYDETLNIAKISQFIANLLKPQHVFFESKGIMVRQLNQLIQKFIASPKEKNGECDSKLLKELKGIFETLRKIMQINHKLSINAFQISKKSFNEIICLFVNQCLFVDQQRSVTTIEQMKSLKQFFFENQGITKMIMTIEFPKYPFVNSNRQNISLGVLSKDEYLKVISTEIDAVLEEHYQVTSKEQQQRIRERTIRCITDHYDLTNLSLKPQNDQIHNRCVCDKVVLLEKLTHSEILNRIHICYYEEKDQELLGGKQNYSCYAEDNNQYQILLAGTQPNLREWRFTMMECRGTIEQITQQSDYFKLKSKPKLLHLSLTPLNSLYFKLVFNQLTNNDHNINTIHYSCTYINKTARAIRNTKRSYKFYKLKRLVVFKRV